MSLGSVGAGCGAVRTLLGLCPNAALMTSGHRLDTASMPPKLAPSDPGNIHKSFVLHRFYKHFAAGADGVRAAPRKASRRRPGSVRAASERRSGNVRATSARCPGGIRAMAGRRPIRRQAIPVSLTNVWFLNSFLNYFANSTDGIQGHPGARASGVRVAPGGRLDATKTPGRRSDAAQTPP